VVALKAIPAVNQIPSRVIIDRVIPNCDHGRYTAKCCLGGMQLIEANILCDGHDKIKVDLLIRHESEEAWTRVPMEALPDNLYSVEFHPEKIGFYKFTIEAAIDRFATWKEGFLKKFQAGNVTDNDILIGLMLMRVERKVAISQEDMMTMLQDESLSIRQRNDWSDISSVRYHQTLFLFVDPALAGFSAWYEFFPRSRWKGIAEKGNLKDAAKRLPYIAGMGFDVVYLPPIHPIGTLNRKGANNSLKTAANDPGSPWAIGNKEGGHKSIDPALGNFEDFRNFLQAAESFSLKVALDIAFQCAPDHPYLSEHPEWFKANPDGSIRYAENPPKKYQDIYPFDFECEAWESLWQELKSIPVFWIEKGVSVFRVDNPHTKSFPFWSWLIAEIRKDHPEVIFLAEAFTTPSVMTHLAKIGFNQSYTYFTWRQNKAEIIDYLQELTATDLKYYFRPNFWPNTPDILPMQLSTRASYIQRFILAATLSPNYGIYGPLFELMAGQPLAAESEEYRDSEKYQIYTWDIEQGNSLAPLIRRVNSIRKSNLALQTSRGLRFHPIDNDQIIAYTRQSGDNLVLVVVNLDPHNRQSGIVDLQIQLLGLGRDYHLHDLLDDAHYDWSGWKNYVELDPDISPAHIFHITQKEQKNALA
jgi:starch synthase (maltosyl-transferring)